MKSRAILILGMHRCGTSALARCLGFLGAELGSELVAPAVDNPTGFWEDRRLLAINQRLTELLGEEGDRWWEHSTPPEIPLASPRVRPLLSEALGEIQGRFGSSGWWAFKDPRTLRAYPFWEAALQEAGVGIEQVIAVRHPLACAESLTQRNQLPEGRSLLLWTSQYLAHWPRIAARPFAAVDYDLLLEEPERELRRLSDHLGLRWRREVAEEARGFLRPELRHARFRLRDLQAKPNVPPLVVETFEALEDLSVDHERKSASLRMQALHAEFLRAVPLLRALDSEWIRTERSEQVLSAERRNTSDQEEAGKRQVEELCQAMSTVKAKLEETEAILAARERDLSALRTRMESSRTWRFLLRLRGLERSFRGLRKRLLGAGGRRRG
ncbi:MAG: sulfotransferase family protein [Candidatus Methylacidiphilaceae bacterium]